MRNLMLLFSVCVVPLLSGARWVWADSWPWVYDHDSASWHYVANPVISVWSPEAGWGTWGEEIEIEVRNWAPESIAGKRASILAEGSLVVTYRFYSGNQGTFETAAGQVDFTYLYRRESATRGTMVLNVLLANGEVLMSETVLTFDGPAHGTYEGRMVSGSQSATERGEFWVE